MPSRHRTPVAAVAAPTLIGMTARLAADPSVGPWPAGARSASWIQTQPAAATRSLYHDDGDRADEHGDRAPGDHGPP